MSGGIGGGEGLDYSYPSAFRDDSREPVVVRVNEFDQLVDEAMVFLKEKAKAGLEKVRNLLPRKEK